MRKTIIVSLLLSIVSFGLSAQKLQVQYFDEADNITETVEYQVGDVIVLAHKKDGKNVHYFEGKVTGVFQERGVIRVFDYARSERAVSIVGKKIKVDEIVGVKRPSKEEIKRRENQAVATTAASVFGSMIGGNAGAAISAGSVIAGVGLDITSRDAVSQQRIKCQIIEY